MPQSPRRRAQQQQRLAAEPDPDDTDSEIDLHASTGHDFGAEEEESEGVEDELDVPDGEDEFDEDDALASPHQANNHLLNLDPPPSYLREISTLASWTVSSSKPGCSIPQLRHPSTSLFWQSDGPQPHYLNIHFFKLVRIVGLRLYLDFEQDESYTPTRIIFLAGSGMNDLQEWGEMKLESPRGWVWADFSGVGDVESDSGDDDEGDEDAGLQRMNPGPPTANDTSSDSENNAPRPRSSQAPADDTMQIDPQTQTPLPYQQTGTPQDFQHHHHAATPTLTRPTPRLPFAALSPTNTTNNNNNNTSNAPQPASARRKQPKMPVLRAHLVQIKILENHQNGKDTHLRGLQIFARNDEDLSRVSPTRYSRNSDMKTLMGEEIGRMGASVGGKGATGTAGRISRRLERLELGSASRSAWDVEPSIR